MGLLPRKESGSCAGCGGKAPSLGTEGSTRRPQLGEAGAGWHQGGRGGYLRRNGPGAGGSPPGAAGRGAPAPPQQPVSARAQPPGSAPRPRPGAGAVQRLKRHRRGAARGAAGGDGRLPARDSPAAGSSRAAPPGRRAGTTRQPRVSAAAAHYCGSPAAGSAPRLSPCSRSLTASAAPPPLSAPARQTARVAARLTPPPSPSCRRCAAPRSGPPPPRPRRLPGAAPAGARPHTSLAPPRTFRSPLDGEPINPMRRGGGRRISSPAPALLL